MKLSISNIAWDKEKDIEMYEYLSKLNFSGIEIAPTRIFEIDPYFHIEAAKQWKENLESNYDLEISSMQSIWYGKKGNIFNSDDAKKFIEYTKKAIDFANSIKCNNLVFGCPKNRVMPEGKKEHDVIEFFRTLGNYAKEKQTVLALEPNPTIYGTNFINYTDEAFNFVKKINSEEYKKIVWECFEMNCGIRNSRTESLSASVVIGQEETVSNQKRGDLVWIYEKKNKCFL